MAAPAFFKKVRRLFSADFLSFFILTDSSNWFHGELRLGRNDIVTAFHVETKPLALNAFSKSRFVLAQTTKKVKIAKYPESAGFTPTLCLP